MITRLRGGNAQFPEGKVLGDIVVLGNGEIFCYDGQIWQLIGGRFIPTQIREAFLWYVREEWPDPSSARFDLPTVLDLGSFVPEPPSPTRQEQTFTPEQIEKWVGRFAEKVVWMAEKIEKASKI